ncbi:MAG: single-stranded-DNA-specific exonuclease RecJ [Nitrospirae bacterium]|nr:single-stranded-DNA-specific exonuclease RecJ [Nitrospirota bacterium]
MRWVVSRTNREYLQYLSAGAGISPALAQILVNRKISTPEDATRFLKGSTDNLRDPFLLPDMDRAVARIRKAAENGEMVLIHGDYDVDGLTSTAIMMEALRMIGANARFIIPNRLTDGYGLSESSVRKAASLGARLIITVDCGISAVDEVRLAASLGMDVVITDHHSQTGELPAAVAVVNPHRAGSGYPFKDLAGAGVAWKVAEALAGRDRAMGLIDLAAMGTVADVVPLVDENRIIVKTGLLAINAAPRPGVRALLQVAGAAGKPVTGTTIGFALGPRINAAGRLGDAAPVVDLLTTGREDQALAIAGFLHENNRQRQEIEAELLKSARAMIDPADTGVTVACAEGWHHGVLGIAAARLADEFSRPVILLSVENGLAKGSGRSIPPFDLTGALTRCADMLEGFGGHHQAAGVRIQTARINEFRARMSEILAATLDGKPYLPSLRIDAAVSLSEVSYALAREIAMLEPFGCGNPEPVLGCKGVEPQEFRIVGKNHLKMRLRQGLSTLDSIGFDMGGDAGTLQGAGLIDAAFTPQLNEWNGRVSVQLNLKGVRAAS